jgi:hypothetical protein
MQMSRYLLQFTLAALLVIILGGLAGWYFFIRGAVHDTNAAIEARDSDLPAQFGSPTGSTYQNIVEDLTGSTTPDTPKKAPRLWHVTPNPVAGFGFYATSSKVFFAEVATGNVFFGDPDTSFVERRTNVLFPKTKEAIFADDGAVLLRFSDNNETISTFAGVLASTTATLSATATPQTLSGLYLPQEIGAIAAGSAHKVVYLLNDPQGGMIAFQSNWKGTGQKRLLSSPLSGWNLYWLADGRVIISQKAADGISGYAYVIKADGTLVPLVSDLPGLTIVPKSGGALLFSTAQSKAVALFGQAKSDQTPVRLPISTLAAKCVWAPGKAAIAYCAVPTLLPVTNYLDAWYQGAVHTTDIWWKVDLSTNDAEKLFTTDSSLSLDVINPSISGDGATIGFLNATDNSLWLLRVTE